MNNPWDNDHTAFPVLRMAESLDVWFPDTPMEDSLRLLGEAARQLEEAASELEESEYDDLDKEVILDSGIQTLENALGLGFVLMQVYVGAVTSRTLACVQCRAWKNLNLSTANLGENAAAIRRKNSPLVSGTDLTYADAVHHVGNLFKHEEEFPASWNDLSPRQQVTAAAVSQLGIGPTSTGNYRTAAKALGMPDYQDFRPLYQELQSWRLAIHQEIRHQARADGCHP